MSDVKMFFSAPDAPRERAPQKAGQYPEDPRTLPAHIPKANGAHRVSPTRPAPRFPVARLATMEKAHLPTGQPTNPVKTPRAHRAQLAQVFRNGSLNRALPIWTMVPFFFTPRPTAGLFGQWSMIAKDMRVLFAHFLFLFISTSPVRS